MSNIELRQAIASALSVSSTLPRWHVRLGSGATKVYTNREKARQMIRTYRANGQRARLIDAL